ncbi:hypothetical protein WME79_03180 [Sorangium sp. So ce726]|uniref:hypothetical protein n=1 Tax=Sorangium sp. So ce726 TaxID=3133319 RepID=UPI003F5EB572
MSILVLIAVVVSTPARTAWCEQRVRVAIGETADAALAKNEASTAPGATTEGGESATGAGIVGLVTGPLAVLVEPRPLPDKRMNWVPVITLGAASAVWLGVGIGMTVASRNARSDADGHRAQIQQMHGQCIEPPSDLIYRCRGVEREAGRAARLGTVSVVSYAASGALAIAAATYALWPQRATSTGRALRVLPQAYADGGGVFIVGVW